MATLHAQRQQDTGPAGSPRPENGRWWLVVGVVVVVGVLSVTLALLLRDDHRSVLAGSSPVRGSGVAASETRTLPAFAALELAGSGSVTVRVGTPQSVVVQADDNLVGHVRTTVRSGSLVIYTVGRISTRAPIRVSVVVPEMTSVSLTGSGDVTVDGVDSPTFTASLPGSGTMRAAGRTGHLEASLGGSGQLDLHGLVAGAVEARLLGAGEIEVHAVDSLDVDVSGIGSVKYAGNPARVTRTVTGIGAVEPE